MKCKEVKNATYIIERHYNHNYRVIFGCIRIPKILWRCIGVYNGKSVYRKRINLFFQKLFCYFSARNNQICYIFGGSESFCNKKYKKYKKIIELIKKL